MRTLLLVAIILMGGVCTRAQTVLEALAGDKEAHYINYIDKDVDSGAKWNLFNLNRFTVNYKDKALNTVSIEGQLTYQFKPWIGVSAGGGFYGELFVPTIGLSLSYVNKRADFFVQMYPTIGFTKELIAPSVLGFVGYTPKFSKNWGLSSQIIFSADPIEAAQIIRVGANYKDKIQFGIGVDIQQNFESGTVNLNSGPFIRYNF
jgi:hypothetical protein